MTTLLARIHPRDKARGYLARRYILHGSGYPRFDVDRGWYEVDAEIGKRLRKILNNPNDPGSKPVFQVCSREEAIALEEAERVAIAEATAPIGIPPGVRAKLAEAPADEADFGDEDDVFVVVDDDEDDQEEPAEPEPTPKPKGARKKRSGARRRSKGK